MAGIDETKQALRAQMKALRSAISQAERAAADASICDALVALPEFERADAIFTYLSFGAEVDTRGIMQEAWRAGKLVALPHCVGPRQMRWFRVDTFDNLEKSSFGVEEPHIDPAAEADPSAFASPIALVPGLAFDDAGYRLGYGGGFYDAFLEGFPGMSIGLCRKAQRAESLSRAGVIDAHDRPVNLVIWG